MDHTVTEVAVYNVKEEMMKSFLEQQKNIHSVISGFKGFRSIRSLRSLESPNTFVDYCEWDTPEDAAAANTLASTLPEMQLFFELGDGMISFGHYESTAFTVKG